VPFHLAAAALVGVTTAVTLPDLVLLDQVTPFAQRARTAPASSALMP
jgi:hypothetical protein